MHKKDVPDAIQALLNVLGRLLKKNKDSNVCDVEGLLSGKKKLTVSKDASIGLGSG